MSVPMVSEEMLPWFGIKGECDVYEVPTWNPVTVIRTDQTWGVKFKWETVGGLNHLMAGKFCLQILLERMGPKEAPDIPVKELSFESEPTVYNEAIQVSPGTVPAGAYKVVAILTMKGPKGVPGPIAGIAEGPIVHFYDVGAP